jgi:hypothetical protein
MALAGELGRYAAGHVSRCSANTYPRAHMKNRHGLSRDIPDPVRRAVRQRCGYGCVVCGAAIVEYEHIEPVFAHARRHDPEAIALLCPQCHAKVTRRFMAKSTVMEAMMAPAAKARGFSSEVFDLGRAQLTIVFAGTTIENTPIPITVRGVPLLSIMPGEEDGAPFRLSGHFQNSKGTRSLRIVENEWQPLSVNWDVEAVGGTITIRDSPGHVSLQLRAEPPSSLLVDKLDMYHSGLHFLGDSRTLEVTTPQGGKTVLSGCIASNCAVGLAF